MPKINYEPSKKERKKKLAIILAYYNYARACHKKQEHELEKDTIENIINLTTK